MKRIHRKKRAKAPPGEYPGRKVGYARVSTNDQDMKMQVAALVRAGVDPDQIWSEKVSGVKKKRPQRDLALLDCRRGDTLVVYKLDRLGRSFLELLQIVSDLEARGVKLISTKEGFDTTTLAGKLLFHILGALAEFERGLIAERTRDGVAEALEQGSRFGKPLFFTEKKRAEFERRYKAGESVQQIVDSWGKTVTLIRVRYNRKQLEKLRPRKG
jgi:DNA invertase Pin-like site-specific DNA recombinase